jgi:hypothetical protein
MNLLCDEYHHCMDERCVYSGSKAVKSLAPILGTVKQLTVGRLVFFRSVFRLNWDCAPLSASVVVSIVKSLCKLSA